MAAEQPPGRMTMNTSQPEDLVLTQADVSPGPPAPPSPDEDPKLAGEIRELARRVGGYERLQMLVSQLADLDR